MKITDCTLRTRNIVAGVVFCILFALLWTFLSQPLDVSARSANETVLETGETKADDAMNGTTLLFPEGTSTFDLNGRDLSVNAITSSGADVTITGSGSLVISGVIRMPDSTLRIKLSGDGTLETNGLYMKDGTLLIEGGNIFLNGSYAHADTIRVSGGETIADARADGLRTDSSFQMTGGSVTANGRTHGLHAEGAVEITGGTISLTGGNSAFYYAHPDLVQVSGVQIVSGRNADSADKTESLTAAEGLAYVQIGSAGNTAKKASGNAAANAGASSSATASKSTAAASTSGSANTVTAASATTPATAAASASANTANTVIASSAATSATSAASASTGAANTATTATSAATQSGSAVSSAVSNSATSHALPVSAAGSADAASSSMAASGATSFTAPATADSGMLRRGIILLSVVIAGLLILIRIPEK